MQNPTNNGTKFMIKENLDQLYSFTAKLMTLLEDEVNSLEECGSKDAMQVKKIASDTLNKLVTTFVHLNKMSKAQSDRTSVSLASEDQDIINRFLQRHNEEK